MDYTCRQGVGAVVLRQDRRVTHVESKPELSNSRMAVTKG